MGEPYGGDNVARLWREMFSIQSEVENGDNDDRHITSISRPLFFTLLSRHQAQAAQEATPPIVQGAHATFIHGETRRDVTVDIRRNGRGNVLTIHDDDDVEFSGPDYLVHLGYPRRTDRYNTNLLFNLPLTVI